MATDHAQMPSGIRSFHIRHSRKESREARVANPLHAIFFRALQPGLVEIVRILHERMDPRRHIGVEGGSNPGQDLG